MSKKIAQNANAQMELSYKPRIAPTDIGQMHQYELADYLIHNNPALKSPKGIAVDMGVHISNVYRLAANPKDDGIELIPERLIKFAKSTKTLSVIIKYLKARCEQ